MYDGIWGSTGLFIDLVCHHNPYALSLRGGIENPESIPHIINIISIG